MTCASTIQSLNTDTWKHKIKRMNRALEKHQVEPSLFFANITSDALDIVRGGPRWATAQGTKLRSTLSFWGSRRLREGLHNSVLIRVA
mmetsp:Transcript_53128/g.124285  ORF Transcript_53128/g.124285 Transcript_53128/m.124285 type:complete len:88 (-) Transcript_53128:2348-2611(-)